jgi:Arc/MetJ-type ribon-helix-helix transcriptional regulator
MAVKATLSFADRHHRYLLEKVEKGVFASQSSAVAAAIEQMMQHDEERDLALSAMAEEIRERMQTPLDEYIDWDDVVSELRKDFKAASGG